MADGQRLKLLEDHPQFAQAREIIGRLAQAGHLTVLAGGCVRDSLLGVVPKDLDLATSARPEEVEETFEHTLALGKAFGTIVVVRDACHFEVTTFRKDGPYVDGRRPLSVAFASMEEDAKRRDFTVNALFYDPLKQTIFDYVGGQTDLARGLLRPVGDARLRFREDRLRMLRAVRFVAQLGFDLQPEAMACIRADHHELAQVSIERIFNETRRMLESDHLPKGLAALLDSRQEKVFWPELSGLNIDELLAFPKFLNWENAFAAICLRRNIKDPEPRLKAWKSPRDSLRRVREQLRAIGIFSDPRAPRAARARVFGGEAYGEVVVLLQGLFDGKRIHQWVEEYLEIADAEGALPKPFLTGEDFLQMGVKPGEEMGELIRQLFDAQLEARVRSRPEALSELKRLRS